MKRTRVLIISLLLYSISSRCANLDSLEKKITDLEKSVIQIKAEKHTSDLTIAIIAGGGVIFSLIYTLKNILDKKESSKSAKKSEEIFEWQKASNKELMDYVTKNIQASTNMVNSIETMINLSKTATKIQDKFANEEKIFDNSTSILNKKSIRINDKFSRKDYYSIYFDNAAKDVHEGVRLLLASNPDKKETEYSSFVSPSAYYLTSLYFFKYFQYKDCRDWLDKTIKKCSEGLLENNDKSEIIFPDENGIISHIGGRKEWIGTILNNTYFFYGLVEMNEGKYKEAGTKFLKAIEYNNADFESELFHIQSTYFSEEGSFDNIKTRIEQVKSNIKKSKNDNSAINFLLSRTELLESYFYFPIVNNTNKNPFISIRNAKTSFDKLRKLTKASDLIETFDYLPLSYHLNNLAAAFSYYQILKNQITGKQNIIENFTKSQIDVRIKEVVLGIIQDGSTFLSNIDKDNIIQLFYINYIVAVAYEEISQGKKNEYLLNTKLHLKMFSGMSNFKLFSPVSKSFIDYPALQSEISVLFT